MTTVVFKVPFVLETFRYLIVINSEEMAANFCKHFHLASRF